MLKKLYQIILLGLLAICSAEVCAQGHMVEVSLIQLEAQKLSKHNEKLYFSITEYPTKGHPTIAREPIYPLHWLNKDLSKLNNVKLWAGKIDSENSVLLIFSLMQQELPPFDVDEHLGSVQVKLVNNKGKVEAVWGTPHFSDQPKIEQPDAREPKYLLIGPHGDYSVVFKVKVLD
jgi:hypothetical protein